MPQPILPGFGLPPQLGGGGGGGPINWMANLGSAGRAAAGAPVLPGSSPFNYDPRFGGIPGVPSPGQTAGQAIGSNIGNLGQIYSLGTPLNQFTAQQAPTSLNLNLPQYQGMIGQSSGNILSKLQGQIPQDVANQIQQFGAERGVATGSIGSPNANAATLRALGLTSLGLQNEGEQQLTQAIGRTPQGAQFNPFGFLVSPQEQQAAQYQANLLNAAPVPSSAQFAGLNAFQSGRGSGYSGFPSSAPASAPYVSPYSPGQQPLGSTPYGMPTGTGQLAPFSGFADEFFPGLDEPTSFDSPSFDPSSWMDFGSDNFDTLFG